MIRRKVDKLPEYGEEAAIKDTVATALIADLMSITDDLHAGAEQNDRVMTTYRNDYFRAFKALSTAIDAWSSENGESLNDISDKKLIKVLILLGAVNPTCHMEIYPGGQPDELNPVVIPCPVFDGLRYTGRNDDGGRMIDSLMNATIEARSLLAGVAIGRNLIRGDEAREAITIYR